MSKGKAEGCKRETIDGKVGQTLVRDRKLGSVWTTCRAREKVKRAQFEMPFHYHRLDISLPIDDPSAGDHSSQGIGQSLSISLNKALHQPGMERICRERQKDYEMGSTQRGGRHENDQQEEEHKLHSHDAIGSSKVLLIVSKSVKERKLHIKAVRSVAQSIILEPAKPNIR